MAMPEKKAGVSAPEKLIVVHAFADYRRGDAITDQDEIAKVLQLHAEKVHALKNTD